MYLNSWWFFHLGVFTWSFIGLISQEISPQNVTRRAVIPRCSCMICGPRYCTSALEQREEWRHTAEKPCWPWRQWLSHFYSKCVSISSFPDRLLFGPPKTICWEGWTRMGPSTFPHWSSTSATNCLGTSLLNFMSFISVFHVLRGSELNADSRYGPTSALSREADCFPCCSTSAPVNAAQGALGLHCH